MLSSQQPDHRLAPHRVESMLEVNDVYRFCLSSSYVVSLGWLCLHKKHLLEDFSHLRHAEIGCVERKARYQC